MRGGLPRHLSANGALESFHMGCPGAVQQVPIVPQKEPLKGASHISQREKPPWPRDSVPFIKGPSCTETPT